MDNNAAKEVTMPLLENGLDFILHGLNELSEMDKKPNNGKYAILHIHAGTELVLKERLRQEHWSLIFSKEPDIKAYNSGDFLGIYMDECIKRLDKVCGIVFPKNDINALDTLRKRRNKIEHFKASYNSESLSSIIVNALSVLLNFINSHFEEDALSIEESTLLKDIRQKVGNIEEFVSIKMKEISTELLKHKNIVGCPVCHQKAAIPDEGLECLFCGTKINDPEEAANAYLTDYLGLSDYEIVKEGGEWPLYECPDCENETMVYDEDGHYICFNCGIIYNDSDLTACSECGKLFVATEDNDGIDLCENCIDYKINKD